MDVTPKSVWPAVKAMLHSAYDQPDANAVDAQYDRLLDYVDDKWPPCTNASTQPARTYSRSRASQKRSGPRSGLLTLSHAPYERPIEPMRLPSASNRRGLLRTKLAAPVRVTHRADRGAQLDHAAHRGPLSRQVRPATGRHHCHIRPLQPEPSEVNREVF